MKGKRLTAAVCMMVLLLAGCGEEEVVTETPKGTAVEVATVERTDMARSTTVNGMVTAKTTVPVVPMLAGVIKELKVEAGDMVSKGEVLLRVDTSTVTGTYSAMSSSYASTKQAVAAGIEAAQAQLDLAKTNYDNTLALFAIGAASQLEVDAAKVQYDAAVLGIEQAKAQGNASLSSIQAQMDQIGTQASLGTVKAPVSGKVIAVNVVEGGLASQSAALVIAEGGETRIAVSVSENTLPGLAVGDVAEVRIASASQEVYEVAIETIAPAVNAQTGLYDVVLYTPEGLTCPIGAFAEVTFYTDKRPDAVVVPTEAILNDGVSQYVFVVEGETVRRVGIETGLIGESETEVLSGLVGGETLVTVGQSYLADGALVRVVGEN